MFASGKMWQICVQTWCWKRHIVAFSLLLFRCHFLFVPAQRGHGIHWRVMNMNIHGPFHLVDIRMASVVFIGIFLFSSVCFCQNTDGFVERVQNIRIHLWTRRQWVKKAAHISFSHRHKHNLIDTFSDLFVFEREQRTDSWVTLRGKWFCLRTYKRQYHKLFVVNVHALVEKIDIFQYEKIITTKSATTSATTERAWEWRQCVMAVDGQW